MQEVALAAVRQQAPLADPQKVAPWLYRLAVAQSLLYRRRLGRRRRLTEHFANRTAPTEHDVRLLEPLDWLLADERRSLVRRAILRLSARRRVIVAQIQRGLELRRVGRALGRQPQCGRSPTAPRPRAAPSTTGRPASGRGATMNRVLEELRRADSRIFDRLADGELSPAEQRTAGRARRRTGRLAALRSGFRRSTGAAVRVGRLALGRPGAFDDERRPLGRRGAQQRRKAPIGRREPHQHRTSGLGGCGVRGVPHRAIVRPLAIAGRPARWRRSTRAARKGPAHCDQWPGARRCPTGAKRGCRPKRSELLDGCVAGRPVRLGRYGGAAHVVRSRAGRR